jgi:hypothetical protein
MRSACNDIGSVGAVARTADGLSSARALAAACLLSLLLWGVGCGPSTSVGGGTAGAAADASSGGGDTATGGSGFAGSLSDGLWVGATSDGGRLEFNVAPSGLTRFFFAWVCGATTGTTELSGGTIRVTAGGFKIVGDQLEIDGEFSSARTAAGTIAFGKCRSNATGDAIELTWQAAYSAPDAGKVGTDAGLSDTGSGDLGGGREVGGGVSDGGGASADGSDGAASLGGDAGRPDR